MNWSQRVVWSLWIEDNGRGMSSVEIQQVVDPFYTTRTTRKVGLGLSLFAAAAKRCNGKLSISSQPGKEPN